MTFPIGDGPDPAPVITNPFGGFITPSNDDGETGPVSAGGARAYPSSETVNGVTFYPGEVSGAAAGGTLGWSINTGTQVINGVVYQDGEEVGQISEGGFLPIDVLDNSPSTFPGITIPGGGPDWLLDPNAWVPAPSFGEMPGAPFVSGYVSPYSLGDEFSLFESLGPDQIAEIQLQFVEAGLVDVTDFTYGEWDEFSSNLMLQTMSHANQHHTTWQAALANLSEFARQERARQGGGGGGGRAAFVAPAYRPPDYATLTQEVKGFARNKLGRELRDYEIDLLAENMQQEFRKAYDADIKAARANYDAQVAGRASGGEVETVDPAARFAEYFDERYRPELTRIENVGDATQNRAMMMQSIIGGDSFTSGNDRRNAL